MNHFFKKNHRLLKKKDFQRVFDEKNKLLGKYLKIYYRNALFPKIGIVASSAFGKAHIRNLFKRRMREAFRLNKNHLLELIVLPTPLAKSVKYQDLCSEFLLLTENATFSSQKKSL